MFRVYEIPWVTSDLFCTSGVPLLIKSLLRLRWCNRGLMHIRPLEVSDEPTHGPELVHRSPVETNRTQ